LGFLGTGKESHAYGVNTAGHICGDSATDVNINCGNAPPHAFLYNKMSNPPMLQLDANASFTVAQSRALALNSSDVVVGYWNSDGGSNSLPRAFVWSGGTGFLNLLDQIGSGSGWTSLTTANAINDSGVIVGQGNHNGAVHAFMMTPGPSIPEKSLELADVAVSRMRASMVSLPSQDPASAPMIPGQLVLEPTLPGAVYAASQDTSQTERAGGRLTAFQDESVSDWSFAIASLELPAGFGGWEAG
jgi:hypothetical protein